MTPETKFEVGQPVWVFVNWSDAPSEWCKGRIIFNNSYELYVVNWYKYTLVRHCETFNAVRLIPRPTLLWSIREWFSSLRN